MADKQDDPKPADEQPKQAPRSSSATKSATKPAPTKPKPKKMPPWKVLLHNDDVNDMIYVIQSIVMLTPLGIDEATDCMWEAHGSGTALLLVTHQERAELYQEQFTSRGLTVTVEPDGKSDND